MNVLPIRVPSLRERLEDVPMLAAHFLRQACAANDRRGKSLSDGAMKLLAAYDYPGNVRELRNNPGSRSSLFSTQNRSVNFSLGILVVGNEFRIAYQIDQPVVIEIILCGTAIH